MGDGSNSGQGLLPSAAEVGRMSPEALLAVGSTLARTGASVLAAGADGAAVPSLPVRLPARSEELVVADQLLSKLEGTPYEDEARAGRIRVGIERGDLHSVRSLAGAAPSSEMMWRASCTEELGIEAVRQSFADAALATSLPGVEPMIVAPLKARTLGRSGGTLVIAPEALAAHLRRRSAEPDLSAGLARRLASVTAETPLQELSDLVQMVLLERTDLAKLVRMVEERGVPLDPVETAAAVESFGSVLQHIVFGAGEPSFIDRAQRGMELVGHPAVRAALASAPAALRAQSCAAVASGVGAALLEAEMLLDTAKRHATALATNPAAPPLFPRTPSVEEAVAHLARAVEVARGWDLDEWPQLWPVLAGAVGALARESMPEGTSARRQADAEVAALRARSTDLPTNDETVVAVQRAMAAIVAAEQAGIVNEVLISMVHDAEVAAERGRLRGSARPAAHLADALERLGNSLHLAQADGSSSVDRSPLLRELREVQDRLWTRVAEPDGAVDGILRSLDPDDAEPLDGAPQTPEEATLLRSKARRRAAGARVDDAIRWALSLVSEVDRPTADRAVLDHAARCMEGDPASAATLVLEYRRGVDRLSDVDPDAVATESALDLATATTLLEACTRLQDQQPEDLAWALPSLERFCAEWMSRHGTSTDDGLPREMVVVARRARDIGRARAGDLARAGGTSWRTYRRALADRVARAASSVEAAGQDPSHLLLTKAILDEGDLEDFAALATELTAADVDGLPPRVLERAASDLWCIGRSLLGEHDVATGPLECFGSMAPHDPRSLAAREVVQRMEALIASLGDERGDGLAGAARALQGQALLLGGWAHARLGEPAEADAWLRAAIDVAPAGWMPPIGSAGPEGASVAEGGHPPAVLWSKVLAARGSLGAEVSRARPASELVAGATAWSARRRRGRPTAPEAQGSVAADGARRRADAPAPMDAGRWRRWRRRGASDGMGPGPLR